MKFKRNESATKLRGGYYTGAEIAAFLVRWVLAARPRGILEPSCGDGAFLAQIGRLADRPVESVLGFEIDPEEAVKARATAASIRGADVQIHADDFLGWAVRHLMRPPAIDAVVGNPPFIRYQYLDPESQALSEQIFGYFGLPFTKHTNAWVPFVMASVALLRPGGRLAMVVPAELLHVLHAQSLRTLLTRECRQILVFDPEELWFSGVLQGAVLLLAEKEESVGDTTRGVAIVRTRTSEFLNADPEALFRNADYASGDIVAGKWMPALLTARQRELIRDFAARPAVNRFVDVADVDVGIVTGANKFFLVPDAVVDEFGLHPWAYPMFGRSELVPGVIYDERTHERNRAAGLPTSFIWFKDEERRALPASVVKYLERGEAEQLHTRYKCRVRTPWYRVPSVYATKVGMLKRSHDFPRLVLNKVEAFTTDTAYRVQPKGGSAQALVYSFVNSLTALSAELEGRHYGGGVLELVPSEIEKLLVPVVHTDSRQLDELDDEVRRRIEPEHVLHTQDNRVLRAIGASASEIGEIQAAWARLRDRRQRNGSDATDDADQVISIA